MQELKFSLSIPHFRGCSGPANELPRSYHAGDSEEINWILEKYSKICAEQNRELYVFGVSLGGNALLHWAGTYVSNSYSFQIFVVLYQFALLSIYVHLALQ